jgi:uncharacterized protein (DUF58 family)
VSDALLDPAFARELEALRRRVLVRARSGAGGERAAKRRGSSAEFMEHRRYASGDDPRRIDWLAFARTGEPVLKLFRADEDAIARVAIDASASLEGAKLATAKRVCAAVAYMALAESERAQVLACGPGGLERMGEPARGRAALARVLRDLDAVIARGGTDLARAIDAVVKRSARPGLLVVASDFLDPGPWDAAITRAAAAGHDLALVQVLAAEELAPPYDGDFALEDAETGAVLDVTIDAAAVAAYLARLEGLFAALRALARRTRAAYVRTTPSEPTIEAVRRLVARTVDGAA